MDTWKQNALSEYEDYTHRNYSGFRLSVRHIHGAYYWDAKLPGHNNRPRQSYWGKAATLDDAKKASEQAAWNAPIF